MFCFSLQLLYRNKSLHVCFLSSFFPKFWRGQIMLSPWLFFKGTIPIAVRDWRNGAAWLKPCLWHNPVKSQKYCVLSQIRVVIHYHYDISGLVPQTSFLWGDQRWHSEMSTHYTNTKVGIDGKTWSQLKQRYSCGFWNASLAVFCCLTQSCGFVQCVVIFIKTLNKKNTFRKTFKIPIILALECMKMSAPQWQKCHTENIKCERARENVP